DFCSMAVTSGDWPVVAIAPFAMGGSARQQSSSVKNGAMDPYGDGQVVPQQWLAHTTATGVPADDHRRGLDLVVYGATTNGGARCCDATLMSPLTKTGHPDPCTVEVDGAALRVAERRKHCTYSELARGGPQKLLVLGSEIGGGHTPTLLRLKPCVSKMTRSSPPPDDDGERERGDDLERVTRLAWGFGDVSEEAIVLCGTQRRAEEGFGQCLGPLKGQAEMLLVFALQKEAAARHAAQFPSVLAISMHDRRRMLNSLVAAGEGGRNAAMPHWRLFFSRVNGAVLRVGEGREHAAYPELMRGGPARARMPDRPPLRATLPARASLERAFDFEADVAAQRLEISRLHGLRSLISIFKDTFGETAVAPHFNEGDIVRFAAYGRFTRLIGGGQLLADGAPATKAAAFKAPRPVVKEAGFSRSLDAHADLARRNHLLFEQLCDMHFELSPVLGQITASRYSEVLRSKLLAKVSDTTAARYLSSVQIFITTFEELGGDIRNVEAGLLLETFFSLSRCPEEGEKRESLPLPLSFHAFLERKVLDSATPQDEAIWAGSFLACIGGYTLHSMKVTMLSWMAQLDLPLPARFQLDPEASQKSDGTNLAATQMVTLRLRPSLLHRNKNARLAERWSR
ncbi:unnamed protein product, partial [Symbiodinium microadriaticum]